MHQTRFLPDAVRQLEERKAAVAAFIDTLTREFRAGSTHFRRDISTVEPRHRPLCEGLGLTSEKDPKDAVKHSIAADEWGAFEQLLAREGRYVLWQTDPASPPRYHTVVVTTGTEVLP